MDADQITGQMTAQEYIDWLKSLEEFSRYMNKPEKEPEQTKGEKHG